MAVSKTLFGKYQDKDIYLLELTNENGVRVTISTLGATITSIHVPDKIKGSVNVVLGYPTLKEYVDDVYYTGCIVGRFAGRINKGEFILDGRSYNLARNDKGRNHLHGGYSGFNKKVFRIDHVSDVPGYSSVQLFYRSADMEEGYPGNLDVMVEYQLNNDNKLIINYTARTDKTTHVNLTNHTYFNLSGSKNDATRQHICINADSYVETTPDYIPTGHILEVRDTPYDFRHLRKIDGMVHQLTAPGYNECFVLNSKGDTDAVAAILFDPESHRKITVKTSSPGLLFYSGDYLDGVFQKRQGVCFETQFFPDTPNHQEFPQTLLRPGEEYSQQTIFEFSW